jgi:hypothetical protein
MIAKEILLEQFTACFDENNWFVALESALAGLTVEQALWKEGKLDHSIWEMVIHLHYWNQRWLQRYLRGVVEDSKETIDATFRGEGASEEEWQTIKRELFQVFAEWKRIIETIDEAKLSEMVSAEYDSTWSLPIANMNIHNAYHIGQIVLIRKLQGSWNSNQGVS